MKHEIIETPAAEAVMAFDCQRDELHEALQLLARVVERRNTIPVLDCVLIEPAGEAAVSLTATDLDIQLTLLCAARWEGTGRICLPAATLADVVKKAEKGAHLGFRFEDGRMVITHGRSRDRLSGTQPDDFPIVAKRRNGEEAFYFTVPAGQLTRDFARVGWAQGKEETRYYLKGIALQVRDLGAGPQLTTTALDGSNLAWIARDVPAGLEALDTAIVPTKAADMLQRLLKGCNSIPLWIELTDSTIAVATRAMEMRAKLVDGSFPNWLKVALAPEEFQLIGLPETEPRLPISAVEKARKALGRPPLIERGATLVRLSDPDAPEFGAVAMLLKEGTLPKGFAYHSAEDGHARAIDYLAELAAKAGLERPSYTDERDGEERYPASLKMRDGMVIGATFGRITQYAGEREVWEDKPCYETFTIKPVKTVIRHEEEWQEGSYSVAMPRERAGMAAAVTIGTPGQDERAVATNDKGQVILDAAAIARLAGDLSDCERVEMPRLTFHHGRIIARDGIATDGSGRRVVIIGTGEGLKRRLPKGVSRAEAKRAHERQLLEDAELARAYCEAWAPQYFDDAPAVEMAAAEPVAAETAEPAEIEPQETPQEAQEATPDATYPAATSEITPDGPENGHSGDIEAAGEVIGAMFAALEARIAALEAANGSGTQPEDNSAVEPAATDARAQSFSRERRLRIIKRYLAMRAERKVRAFKWDREREDYCFTISDLSGRLKDAQGLAATEAARADTADARWQTLLDAKQARIVALENEKIERLSGGRIRLTHPLHAKPLAFPLATAGRA